MSIIDKHNFWHPLHQDNNPILSVHSLWSHRSLFELFYLPSKIALHCSRQKLAHKEKHHSLLPGPGFFVSLTVIEWDFLYPGNEISVLNNRLLFPPCFSAPKTNKFHQESGFNFILPLFLRFNRVRS